MLIVYFVIGFYYRRRHELIEKDVIKSQKREKVLVSFVGISLSSAPLLYLVGLADFASFQLLDWQRVVGALCALIGLAYFRWSHSALGKNWSLMLELMKDHELITSGPYKYVRHPMYASIYLTHVGFLILTANWLVGVLLLAPFTILYIVRVRSEEQMMIEKFGQKYLDYMKGNGRLFPKLF
ncbi:MAG: isoprenylcysteine carboxylmethyltransferase family protein [Thaumarchaeota archaeon]|nr:isoprenylcysteine carboxylmethyltransferase family protein [Nitrososphaerota archaeon]